VKNLEATPGGARDMTLHPMIVTNLRNLSPRILIPEVPLESHGILPEWDQKKALIIWGPTDVGKTQLAKALLPKALFINHIDQLAAYNDDVYEGFILDDCGISHLHREAQLAILDTGEDRAIHRRYGISLIPKGTPRILATNDRGYQAVGSQWPEIVRRCQFFHKTARDRCVEEMSEESNPRIK